MTTQAKPAVRVKKPGISAAFTAMWSAIIMFLQGVEEYAAAFKEVGTVTKMTATHYKEEAEALHEQEMEQYRNEA